MVVHPSGQYRFFDGAHQPGQKEHGQHKAEVPACGKQEQAQDVPGAGKHDKTGAANGPFFLHAIDKQLGGQGSKTEGRCRA